MKLFIKKIILLAFIFNISLCYAEEELISLFPLSNYNQDISNWIKPSDAGFNQSLLTEDMQNKRMEIFYDHYFGLLSPWNEARVNRILKHAYPDDLKTIEESVIENFNNQHKPDNQIGYGENFRPHSEEWIKNIANNINLAQFNDLSFEAHHRAIAVDNLHARALPTEDVYFYSHKLAGEGYPFDNLQMSALWAGTPLYIIGETKDHAWMLVITPDYIGWVKSSGVARASKAFIATWSNAAKNKLIAITKTQASLTDHQGRFLLSAYVGSVFPGEISGSHIKMMLPVFDADHHAMIKQVKVTSNEASPMPLRATPHHFSDVMHTLIGRPYGWGGMYFYNDCSAELKSLFTPFGIWIPRHSSDQVTAGKMVDMSFATADKRLSYLMQNGKRFLTIIYIGGHIMMYLGNYSNPNNQSLMAMTYQDIWGLSPKPAIRRAVIGQSVLIPILLQYPEDNSLVSLADKKYFQISYLNQLPVTGVAASDRVIDLRTLMFPELLNTK